MKKLLVMFLALVVVAAAFAGADYSGTEFADSITIDGEAVVSVYQWFDVGSVIYKVKDVIIEDYGEDYTYLPQSSPVIMFIIFNSNADVKVRVEGELYDYETNEEFDYVADDLLKVQYRLYESLPNTGTFYPTNDWVNLGEEVVIEDHNYTLQQDYNEEQEINQALGIGMIFTADKDLPAGKYKFIYQVIFNPTVVF